MASLVSISRTSKKEVTIPTEAVDSNKKASVRYYKHWHDQLRRNPKYSKWSIRRRKQFLEARMEDFWRAHELINESPYV